jgi:NAD(P)-dependent dehydrogenase (short-subunit alcohol dehydrogenase family)
MGSLEGKVAVVTGGGSGIGRAIAEAFSAEGATCVLAARGRERLEAAAAAIPNADAFVCDVTNDAQVDALFEHTAATHGPVDILINNAGMAAPGLTHELSPDAFRQVLSVNLTGCFLCARKALQQMIPRKSGRILNIGSISGQMSRPHSVAYTTSKFGLDGFTRSLALDAREHGIAVSILHPGNVGTDIWKDRIEMATAEGLIPLADMGRAALAMVTLDPSVNMLSSVILPVSQPYLGRG